MQGWEFALCFFCANCSIFVSEMAIRSFVKRDLLLGIKMGKAVKNFQKHGENNEFFLERIACFLRAKERKCDSLSKSKRMKSERAHSQPFKINVL